MTINPDSWRNSPARSKRRRPAKRDCDLRAEPTTMGIDHLKVSSLRQHGHHEGRAARASPSTWVDGRTCMSEICENCGKQIGDLETPHVFQGHIVCTECDKRLRTGGSPPEMPDASKEHSERKAPGEERVLYAGRPSMWRNRPVGFVLSLFLIPVFGVGLVILAIWYLKVLGTRLTVTSERTTLRHGILSKHISEVLHRDIRHVQLRQGALQRLLGVGTIELGSAGHAGVELAVSGITNPHKVKQIIDEQRRYA